MSKSNVYDSMLDICFFGGIMDTSAPNYLPELVKKCID